MDSYQKILDKLNGFSRRYYTKELLKGFLLFLTMGMLFWIMVTSLEHFFWFQKEWRLFLFVFFLAVELFLVYRFIVIPLVYLFQLRRGMSQHEASKLIGKHFPAVDDKLYNLLELAENRSKSELLQASIDQRSKNLGPVPFTEAVNVLDSLKYAKYVVLPLLLFGLIWLSGNVGSFFGSHQRVMNYDVAYERPAPFTFKVLNESLEVLDNEPLTVRAVVEGDVLPENVFMMIDGVQLMLQKQDGFYVHTFRAPVPEGSFYLTANGWNSRNYGFRSLKTPSVDDFEMELRFPEYINRKTEVVNGSGNAVVPEGTLVVWKFAGRNVEQIDMEIRDTSYVFDRMDDVFSLRRRVFNDMQYQLSTSNGNVKHFETLNYTIEVDKDNHPTVQVEQFMDSLNPNQAYYVGHAADDYGLARIQVVCYPTDDTDDRQKITLETPRTNVHQFYYTFPSGLELELGRRYQLFFEVIDNDALSGGKVVRSRIFNTALYDYKQLKDKELELQNTLLHNIDDSLDKYKKQRERLSEINRDQREKNTLTFEDKNEIRDFLQKQKQQEQLMEKFSRQLNESLEKDDLNGEMKRMLQERLERQELEARKNEKLLRELNELTEKIDREEFKKRLDELGKKQSSNARNLEQILELTKRYYVTEKASKFAKDLEELSEQQKVLSELKLGEDFTDKEQKSLNEEFERLAKELSELKKDNDDLQKPLDLDIDNNKSDEVKKDQQEALDEIEDAQNKGGSMDSNGKEAAAQRASKKQKSAAQKMKELGDAMKESAMGGGASSITEDAEMLRQILDNLVTFSFKQENLFDQVSDSDLDVGQYAKTVRDQKELRRLFEHVDDSLFALSLRRAELSEFVNEQITEVYYNIDKSLESIAENQIYQGASYQQYVMSATNALADFLANILDNMQQSMSSGQGNGSGSDFQLPDIIKGQQGIQEKMKGSGQEGSDSGQEQQGDGEDGEGKKEGNSDTDGGTDKQGESGNMDKEGAQEGQNGEEELGLKEVYEIYKEQQFLRQQLERQLRDMIDKGDRDLAKKLIQQMEDFENDLLENGITERTRSKSNMIQHQMLKLENAVLKKGDKQERESDTNTETYTNPITTRPELLKEYQNDIEILNRQALPLRQNFEKKVKVYFKND